MKPKTEALLRQCRSALLRRSDEHVAALLAYWFETMIGEEHMEEDVDDLCLLLDYRVKTWGAPTVYFTYTSWWEVEGYLEPGEGIFTCADVQSLRLRLLDMSPKEFDLLAELAFQVRSLLAQMDGLSQPTTGHEGLRETAIWIEQAIPPTRRPEPITPPPLQPAPDQASKQQRRREKKLPSTPPASFTRYTPPDPSWKILLNGLKKQGNAQALPPLAETVVLPAHWEELLTREHLLAFLPFLGLPARTREAKAPLLQRLQERLQADAMARVQLFEVFVHELSVPPWEVETLLDCTTSERKRWVEEGKLPVLDYDSFRKGGSDRHYPLFDRRVILNISPSDLETWRAEHQALVKARRSASARAAAASRKARQSELA